MILIESIPLSPLLQLARPGAYNEAVRAQFGSIPGLRWQKQKNGWVGDPAGIEAALAICEEAKLAKVERATHALWPPPRAASAALDFRLLAYQLEGVAWLQAQLAARGAALLADDMGLGKTPQAIAACDALLAADAPRIVVAPAIVVPHWRREIEKWAQGTPPAAAAVPNRWYIYSYEDFQAALKLPAGSAPKKRPGKHPLIPPPPLPGCIILDEAHYISNGRAKRAAAIAEFCNLHPRMLRLALTGTPINSRVQQLHNILDVLYPSAFGSWWQFARRYADGRNVTIQTRGGEELSVFQAEGAINLEELQARLGGFMLRRTKSEVALQLPERRRILVDVELPARVRKQLAQAQKAIALAGVELGAERASSFAGSASALLSGVEEHKIPAAIELAREAGEQGRKVLLLSTRIATAEAIAAQLGCVCATGATPPEERMRLLQAASLACSTIYAVTTGINLTNFDTIIFVGLDWVPSTLLQAEARIHRIGQSSGCLVYYLIGEGSIDEIVRSQVLNRLEIFEKALGSEDSGLQQDLAYANVLAAFAAKLEQQLTGKAAA